MFYLFRKEGREGGREEGRKEERKKKKERKEKEKKHKLLFSGPESCITFSHHLVIWNSPSVCLSLDDTDIF